MFIVPWTLIIGVTQKGAYVIPLSSTPIFMSTAKGHLYIAWLWWPEGLMLVGPRGNEFLNSYLSKRQQTLELSLPVKEAYCLIIMTEA